jgi:hypothetical protein
MTEAAKPSMKALIKAVRQVMTDAGLSRDWIKSQIVQTIKDVSTGVNQSDPTLISNMVKQEVLRSLGELGWHQRSATDQAARASAAAKFDEHIKGIVRSVIKKDVEGMVRDALSIDIEIRGSVHRPAKDTRALKLEGDE